MAEDRAASQLGLWQEWRDTGDEAKLTELMTSLDPLITHYISRYQTHPIPMNTLRGRAYIMTRDALEKYDPSRAALGTYVMNSLAPMQRYVKAYQNPVYISEALSSQFGELDKARRELELSGKAPTSEALAEQMGTSTKAVERMMAAMTPPALISALADEAETESGAYASASREMADNLIYLRTELKGKELKAYDKIMKASQEGQRIPMNQLASELDVPLDMLYGWRKKWNRRLRDAQTWS